MVAGGPALQFGHFLVAGEPAVEFGFFLVAGMPALGFGIVRDSRDMCSHGWLTRSGRCRPNTLGTMMWPLLLVPLVVAMRGDVDPDFPDFTVGELALRGSHFRRLAERYFPHVRKRDARLGHAKVITTGI